MNDYWQRLIELERRTQRISLEFNASRSELQRVASDIGTVSRQLPGTILRPVIEGDCFTWSNTVCLRVAWFEHQPAFAGENVKLNAASTGFAVFRKSPSQVSRYYTVSQITSLRDSTLRIFDFVTLTKISETQTTAEYYTQHSTWSYWVRLTKASGTIVVFFYIDNGLSTAPMPSKLVIYSNSGYPVGNQPTPGVPGITGSATIYGLARLREPYTTPTVGYDEYGTGGAEVTISWGTICGAPVITPPPTPSTPIADGGSPGSLPADAIDGGSPDALPTDIIDGGGPADAVYAVDSYDSGSPDALPTDIIDSGSPDALPTDITDGGEL